MVRPYIAKARKKGEGEPIKEDACDGECTQRINLQAGSALGIRFPQFINLHAKVGPCRVESAAIPRSSFQSDRVKWDVGPNSISSDNGATVSVVAVSGTPLGLKDGSATDVMEEIVDRHDAAYHDPGDTWPSP